MSDCTNCRYSTSPIACLEGHSASEKLDIMLGKKCKDYEEVIKDE